MTTHRILRWSVGIVSCAGLIAVFIFQGTDLAVSFGVERDPYKFFINRTARFLLNDAFAMGLIFALFFQRAYTLFALIVQLTGVVLILVPYFVIKFWYPDYNGPLISFLHRLVLNPTLLMLLIPALYFQRLNEKKEADPAENGS